MPDATIVVKAIPSDFELSVNTLRHAREIAGMDTCGILIADYQKRGCVFLDNAAAQSVYALGTPYVAFLDNDSIPVTDGWLKKMCDALALDPTYAIAAPSGNSRGKCQKLGAQDPPVQIATEVLAFICGVVKTDVFKRIGEFSGEYTHYASEIDLQRRAWMMGYKSIWVSDVWLDREVKPPCNEQWWNNDISHYYNKWNHIPVFM